MYDVKNVTRPILAARGTPSTKAAAYTVRPLAAATSVLPRK
jgi:hypothetical protein